LGDLRRDLRLGDLRLDLRLGDLRRDLRLGDLRLDLRLGDLNSGYPVSLFSFFARLLALRLTILPLLLYLRCFLRNPPDVCFAFPCMTFAREPTDLICLVIYYQTYYLVTISYACLTCSLDSCTSLCRIASKLVLSPDASSPACLLVCPMCFCIC